MSSKLIRNGNKSKRSFLPNIFMLVFLTTPLLFLSACGSGGGDISQQTEAPLTNPTDTGDTDNEYNNVDEGPTSELRLVVQDISGTPVPNARLSFHKKETSQLLRIENTDANGEFLFKEIPVSHLYAIEIDHKDYAIQVVTTKNYLREKEDNKYTAILLAMSPAVIVNAEEGTTIEPSDSDGTKITIPPNAFVNVNGEVVTGSIEIRVRNLDVSNADEMSAYPGELRGVSNDEVVSLFTYGVFSIDATQNNSPLNLAEGKTIRVEIPVLRPLHSNGTMVKVGDTIPLWWLDLDTGIWHKEGTTEVVEAPNTPLKLAGVIELTHILEPVSVDADADAKSSKKLPFVNGQTRAINCATSTKPEILAEYHNDINEVPSSCMCANPGLFGLAPVDCPAGVDRILHIGRRGTFNLDAELPQHKITARFRNPSDAIESNRDILLPEKMCLGVRVVHGYFKDRDATKYPGEKEANCNVNPTTGRATVDTQGHGIVCHGWTLDDSALSFKPSTDAPFVIPQPTGTAFLEPYAERKNICYLYNLSDSVSDDGSKYLIDQTQKGNYSCFCLDDAKDNINQRFWMEWEFTWGEIVSSDDPDHEPGWRLYTDGSKTPRNSRYNDPNTLDKWWDDDKDSTLAEAEDSDGIPYNKDPECFSVTPPTPCFRTSDDSYPMSENPKVHYLANERPTYRLVPEEEIVSQFANIITENTGSDAIPGDVQPYNVANPTAAQANDEVNYIVATTTSGRLSRERFQNAYSGDLSTSCIKHANDGFGNANKYGKLSAGVFTQQNCDSTEIFAPRTKGPARKYGTDYIIEEGESGQLTFAATDKEYVPNLIPLITTGGGLGLSVSLTGLVRAPHFTFSGPDDLTNYPTTSAGRPLFFGKTSTGKALLWNLDSAGTPLFLEPKRFLKPRPTPTTATLTAAEITYLNDASIYMGVANEVWFTFTIDAASSGIGTFQFSTDVTDYSITSTTDSDGYTTNSAFNSKGLPDSSGGRRKTNSPQLPNYSFIINGKPVMKNGLTFYVNKATSGQSYNLNAKLSQPGLSCTLASGSCTYPYATLSTSIDELSTDTDSRISDPHTYVIVSGANFTGGSTITYNYPANSTATAKVTAYVIDSRGRPSLNSDGSIQTGALTVLVNTPPTACNVTAPEQQKNIEGSFKIEDLACTDGGTKTDSDSMPSVLKYYLVANTTDSFVKTLADNGTVTYRPTIGTTTGDSRTFTYLTFDGAAYSEAKTVTVVTKNTVPVPSTVAGTSPGNRISITSSSSLDYKINLRPLISDINNGFATETYTYALQSSSGHIGGAISVISNEATFLPTTPGDGQFTITVTDASSESNNIVVYYTVNNDKPSSFTVNDCSSNDPTGCVISWNIPTDSNGHSVYMKVDGTSVGVTTSLKVSPGNHTVEACDSFNLCRSVSGTATFTNAPPAAPTISANEGLGPHPLGTIVTTTCSVGIDPDGNAVTIDYCDGSTGEKRTSAGTKTFKARNCDIHGSCSATAEIIVTWQ